MLVGWLIVTRSKADPEWESNRDSSCAPGLFDPVQPNSNRIRDQGKGRTGCPALMKGTEGGLRQRPELARFGTAPMEITNPIGSTALVGFVAFRSRDPSGPCRLGLRHSSLKFLGMLVVQSIRGTTRMIVCVMGAARMANGAATE